MATWPPVMCDIHDRSLELLNSWPAKKIFLVYLNNWTVITGSRRTLIWRLVAQRLLNASSSSSWMRDEFQPSSPLLPVVKYRYRAVCDQDFHGPRCNGFCRPRDDRFGHYDCDLAGRKVCHDGWTGTYCHARTSSLYRIILTRPYIVWLVCRCNGSTVKLLELKNAPVCQDNTTFLYKLL